MEKIIREIAKSLGIKAAIFVGGLFFARLVHDKNVDLYRKVYDVMNELNGATNTGLFSAGMNAFFHLSNRFDSKEDLIEEFAGYGFTAHRMYATDLLDALYSSSFCKKKYSDPTWGVEMIDIADIDASYQQYRDQGFGIIFMKSDFIDPYSLEPEESTADKVNGKGKVSDSKMEIYGLIPSDVNYSQFISYCMRRAIDISKFYQPIKTKYIGQFDARYPRDLDISHIQYVGDIEAIKRRLYMENKRSPIRCLFYGGSGSGKSTLVKELINSLDYSCIFMNVSDPTDAEDAYNRYYPDIIVMDDIDRFSHKKLKRLLDSSSLGCGLIMTCNEVGNMSKPLIRRFTHLFEVKGLPEDEAVGQLIIAKCKQHGVEYSKDIDAKCREIRNSLSAAHIDKYLQLTKSGFLIDSDYGDFKCMSFNAEFYSELVDIEEGEL